MRFVLSTLLMFSLCALVSAEQEPEGESQGKVSYHKQIRPLFQANCQGCHQPAKPLGDYVMTSFDKLVAGGEIGDAAIVPGKPDESYLLDQITPCLLYTSPSPRDQRGSRMPSSA